MNYCVSNHQGIPGQARSYLASCAQNSLRNTNNQCISIGSDD